MRTALRETMLWPFFVGCSVALFVSGGSVAALAHGGGSHHSGGNHDEIGRRASDVFGGRNVDGGYWRHHHHHPGNGPGGLGTVHGPGSSHNPIAYHPPFRPVRPPGAGVGPAKPSKLGQNLTFCELQQSGVNVRDHRSTPGPCRRPGHHR